MPRGFEYLLQCLSLCLMFFFQNFDTLSSIRFRQVYLVCHVWHCNWLQQRKKVGGSISFGSSLIKIKSPKKSTICCGTVCHDRDQKHNQCEPLIVWNTIGHLRMVHLVHLDWSHTKGQTTLSTQSSGLAHQIG